MPEFPDEGEQSRKDYIIARCPLLRTFIDNFGNNDIHVWYLNLLDKFAPIFEGMIKSLGEEKIDTEVNKLVAVAKKLDIFGDDVDDDHKVLYVSVVVALGFEIGEKGDANAFYGDIHEKLVNNDIIYAELDRGMDAAEFTYQLLNRGVNLKQELINDVPEAFRNFKFNLD